MREVKFRAWNDRMYYPETDGCHFVFFSRQGHIPWGLYDNVDGRRLVTGDQDAVFNSPGVLMQFTGLKDKNGKEIYEGDVLRTINGDWGVIVWKAPFFELTVSKEDSSLYSRDWLSQGEVIGNIHQNPELLQP